MQRCDPAIWQNLGVVLLAAGRSSRFGGNKLAADLGGMPVLARSAAIYAALPVAARVAVLGPGAAVPAGFSAVTLAADQPQSGSLAAGVAALAARGLHGILIALADMPLVSPDHLAALAEAYDGSQVVCSLHEGARCPPAIFPPAMAAALTRRSGDRGARDLLAQGVALAAAPGELLDIDTAADLAEAERLLMARGAGPARLPGA